jgi:multiple sugar transport system substrate-binding protein
MVDQEKNSVGRSFESYSFEGHQWALPIDAATPVASSRPDLLEKYGLKLPETFEDLMGLAERGLVAFAGIPIDVLMSFYGFCCSLGEAPCQNEEYVISQSTGIKALVLFRELASKIHPDNFYRNPIQVYEAMTKTDQFVYCPFAYGYTNYSRRGYSRKPLHFHDLVKLEVSSSDKMISTLGGTGLAVSSSSANKSLAVQYANFVASAECQQTVFFENGGQPGHLAAWNDEENNRQTHDYFKSTLPTLQRAFLRPRYHGHMYFQDHAGDIVRDYLKQGGNEEQVLEAMNKLYLESRNLEPA